MSDAQVPKPKRRRRASSLPTQVEQRRAPAVPAGPWQLLWTEGNSATYGMELPQGVMLLTQMGEAHSMAFVRAPGTKVQALKRFAEGLNGAS